MVVDRADPFFFDFLWNTRRTSRLDGPKSKGLLFKQRPSKRRSSTMRVLFAVLFALAGPAAAQEQATTAPSRARYS